MRDKEFDVYFALCGEDTYLVQYLSEHLRHLGHTTFDRSVDRLPETEAEDISEVEALESSRMMAYVLTRDSVGCEPMLAMARMALDKPMQVMVVRFDDAPVPQLLSGCQVVEASRENPERAADKIADKIDC